MLVLVSLLLFVLCRTWIRTEQHCFQSSMDFTATR